MFRVSFALHHQEYIKLKSQPLGQVIYIGDIEVKSVKKYPYVGQLAARHMDTF